MTWSKFDDAAAKCPKALVAGNEAWSLWAAAIMYCNRHLTDGYVSLAALATECLPVAIPLAKAKRLAEQLCAARARPDGIGLFEPAGELFKVHDFLNWNPSKVEVEARRKADRDRKRRGTDSAGASGSGSGVPPSGIPSGKPPDSNTPRASAQALPVPSRPDHAQPSPSESSARAPEVPSDSEPDPRATICPLDLREKAESAGILGDFVDRYGAEPEQIREVIREFVSYWTIGGGVGRKQSNWPKKLREHLRRACEKPGGLKPIGELEHESHGGSGPSRGVKAAKEAGAKGMALMREAQALGGK